MALLRGVGEWSWRLNVSAGCSPLSAATGQRRFLPKHGTKPNPRYIWDFRKMDEITGGKYTHKPLQIPRLGSRHPDTMRKMAQHIGGGVKFDYFMLSSEYRRHPDGVSDYEEKVVEVRKDPNRTAHIALVVGELGKRWIIASANMEAGWVIKTSFHMPANPVMAEEGNSHPIGALPAGTLIHNMEVWPEFGGALARVAGTALTVMRTLPDGRVVIKRQTGIEVSHDRLCMARVGQVSNLERRNQIWGSVNMHRRFGWKQSSGLWHKKDGYQGRRIRPLPPMRPQQDRSAEPPELYKITLTNRQLTGLLGNANVHEIVHSLTWDVYDPKSQYEPSEDD